MLLLLMGAFILPGCVFSLYPLYTEKDVVYDARLEGIWGDTSKDTWKFENLMQHEMAPYKNKPEKEKQEIKEPAY